MTSLLKWLAQRLLGDYAIYRIVAFDLRSTGSALTEQGVVEVDESAVSASGDALVREQAGFCGNGAHVFAVMESGRIVALAAYWHGERYRSRNFWPLQPGEAKLVQIVTVADRRGAGLATRLIQASAARMAALGFGRLYARIWHSNHPSKAAFTRAGWHGIATAIELQPLGVLPRLRIVRQSRPG
jgi:GNAT superfamily N-acetyltransferase